MACVAARKSIHRDQRSPSTERNVSGMRPRSNSSQNGKSAPGSPNSWREDSLKPSESDRSECLQHQHSPKRQTRRPVNSDRRGILLLVIVCALGLVTITVGVLVMGKEKHCSYDELQKQYQNQSENVWNSLTSGVENVINKRSAMPAVYLLIHQGGAKIPDLVKDIVKRAAACVDSSKKPAVMVSRDFATEETKGDYGEAIEKYKAKIKKSRVVLIENLHEIPAGAARALHSICDTYSPIAYDVVIFLTLKTSESNGKPMKDAERALYKLWGKLQSNDLDALITRVTDEVIPLRS